MNASAQSLATASPGAFPEGARIAFVDFDRVASTSTVGKAATTELDALRGKKATEVAERRKQFQALQQKLADSASLMNTEALGKLQRDVERTGRELERFTQDAQEEVQQRQMAVAAVIWREAVSGDFRSRSGQERVGGVQARAGQRVVVPQGAGHLG